MARQVTETLTSTLRQDSAVSLAAGTVHARFEQQAARTPRAVAAIDGDVRMTFEELNARANQLASVLRDLGATQERRIGVLSEPCLDLVVSVLAVLKAGGAFVPLDP